MKITVICDVLGEENNGTTKAAMNLIGSMRERGHEVRVVCPDEDKRTLGGFYVVPRRNFGKALNRYVAKNGVAIAKTDMNVLESAIDGADVVHLLLPFPLSYHALRIAAGKGIPVTASFHCQAENFTSHFKLMNITVANNAMYRLFYDKVLKYCDAIHYPSRFICDVFESRVGATNHYIISNGVNREFRPREAVGKLFPEGRFVILFIGRYSREKSHGVLIDGVGKSAHEKDIQLVFAGSGPLENKIRKYAEKLTNSPVMAFYTRNELVNVINSADLYVHPAEIEIEAISCLESISCGLVPVISDSPRSATKGFALGEDNLFRCNDSDDLAKKIDFWIEHPDEKKKCSESYLGYAAQFDYEVCMDRMEEMFRNVVEKGPKDKNFDGEKDRAEDNI